MRVQGRKVIYALVLVVLVAALVAVAAGSNLRGGAPSTHLEGLGSSLGEIERGARAEGSLELVAWPGYTAAPWVERFARQTGCRVDVHEVATSDAMSSALDTLPWDVVSTSGAESARLVADRRIAPLDKTLVPNYAALVEGVKGGSFPRLDGAPYGMPFGRATNLMFLREDVFPEGTDSSSALWEQGRRFGRLVSLPDDPLVIADAAVHLKAARPDLRIDDPFELDEQQLQAVVGLLHGLDATLVPGALRPGAPAQLPGSADTIVGLASPSAVDALVRSGASVLAVKPIEGTTGRIDAWMVSRKAAHPNCAYLWLDYVASPGVQAAAAESLGLAPVNPAACELTHDPNYCAERHATDDAWWDDVYFQTTPLEDCGDARGATCTNEKEWETAWATLRQRR